jgi:ABC-type amino acid transport substrate-binding protein
MQSTLEAAYAQEYFTGATIVTFPSNIAAILALMSGSVDSIYIDGQDAYTYQTQYSVHTAFRGDSPTDIGAGIVVNKNDTQLREAMNADLRKLLANGTIATLLAAYDPHESTATITGFLETYYKENPSNSYGSGQVALPSP